MNFILLIVFCSFTAEASRGENYVTEQLEQSFSKESKGSFNVALQNPQTCAKYVNHIRQLKLPITLLDGSVPVIALGSAYSGSTLSSKSPVLKGLVGQQFVSYKEFLRTRYLAQSPKLKWMSESLKKLQDQWDLESRSHHRSNTDAMRGIKTKGYDIDKLFKFTSEMVEKTENVLKEHPAFMETAEWQDSNLRLNRAKELLLEARQNGIIKNGKTYQAYIDIRDALKMHQSNIRTAGESFNLKQINFSLDNGVRQSKSFKGSAVGTLNGTINGAVNGLMLAPLFYEAYKKLRLESAGLSQFVSDTAIFNNDVDAHEICDGIFSKVTTPDLEKGAMKLAQFVLSNKISLIYNVVHNTGSKYQLPAEQSLKEGESMIPAGIDELGTQ